MGELNEKDLGNITGGHHITPRDLDRAEGQLLSAADLKTAEKQEPGGKNRAGSAASIVSNIAWGTDVAPDFDPHNNP